MTHPNRSRRKANARRRALRAERAEPSPLEQLLRRNERRYAQLRRYPEPPLYRYSYADQKPRQPACYPTRRP